jgi:hypothetical protein
MMDFSPGFGLDEERRQYVRLHLQERAALAPEQKESYGTPQLANQSALVAVNWHIGVLWQDRPMFLICGLLANIYLLLHALYAGTKWLVGLFFNS